MTIKVWTVNHVCLEFYKFPRESVEELTTPFLSVELELINAYGVVA